MNRQTRHRRACQVHATKRLHERVGDLDPVILKKIAREIQRSEKVKAYRPGYGAVTERTAWMKIQPDGRLKGMVIIPEGRFNVVYDKRLKTVVTVLG